MKGLLLTAVVGIAMTAVMLAGEGFGVFWLFVTALIAMMFCPLCVSDLNTTDASRPLQDRIASGAILPGLAI